MGSVAHPWKKGTETIKRIRIINAYIFFIPVASLIMVSNTDNALIMNLERKEEFSALLVHLDAVFISRMIARSAQVLTTWHSCLLHMARGMHATSSLEHVTALDYSITYVTKSTSGNIKTIGNMVGGQGEK
jgi:hypothetical protein